MKRKGFTLAEVLIALAIIGVVAVLTIPSLVTGYKKDVWGSSLATAVSNFETAMQGMINKEGVYNVYETQAWKTLNGAALSSSNVNSWAARTSDVLKIGNIYKNHTECYGSEKIKVAVGNGKINASGLGIQAESGAVYWMSISADQSKGNPENAISEEEALNRGINLRANVATMIIDVNGKDKPNTIARDVFFFVLGSDGRLYPVGGKDLAEFSGEGATWDDPSSDKRCLIGDIGDIGMGCTARVIENGYKIDY